MALEIKDFKELDEIYKRMGSGDINEIIDMFNAHVSRIRLEATRQFSVGNKVQFNHSKTGELIVGRITKINRKTIKLSTENRGNWTVSPTMIELA